MSLNIITPKLKEDLEAYEFIYRFDLEEFEELLNQYAGVKDHVEWQLEKGGSTIHSFECKLPKQNICVEVRFEKWKTDKITGQKAWEIVFSVARGEEKRVDFAKGVFTKLMN